MGIPRSSLYHRMKVTLSCTLGMLISHGRLTLELAKAVMTVTLPPENKTNLKTFSSLNAVFNYNFELDLTAAWYVTTFWVVLGRATQKKVDYLESH